MSENLTHSQSSLKSPLQTRQAGEKHTQPISRFLFTLGHPLTTGVTLPGEPGAASYFILYRTRMVAYGALSSIRSNASKVNHIGVIEIFARRGMFGSSAPLLFHKLLIRANKRKLKKLHAQEISSNQEALSFWLENHFEIECLLKGVIRLGKNSRDDIVFLGRFI